MASQAFSNRRRLEPDGRAIDAHMHALGSVALPVTAQASLSLHLAGSCACAIPRLSRSRTNIRWRGIIVAVGERLIQRRILKQSANDLRTARELAVQAARNAFFRRAVHVGNRMRGHRTGLPKPFSSRALDRTSFHVTHVFECLGSVAQLKLCTTAPGAS